jgi:dTDP-4-amino-4,6-dideoxygalactose transaminase
MEKIQYFDHKRMHKSIEGEILNALESVVKGNTLILGDEVHKFENAYARYIGSKFAIGVNSGLDALVISLNALGIGAGDEVIVPSNTYIACWNAVSLVGAIPIPVEPNIENYLIDVKKIEEAITSKTKAIMPVHLYGKVCDMSAIMEIASKHNLYVVEDNAQAIGAVHKDKKTGSIGHINGHSFYPTKNLGAMGDGGMITTDEESLYLKAKSLRNYGSSVRYVNDDIGYNSRLQEMQAAILNVKLPYVDKWNFERKHLSHLYNNALSQVGDILLPESTAGEVHHIYLIRSQKRDALMQYLTTQQIDSLIHYPIPPHMQHAYKHLNFQKGDLPIAELIAQTCLSLPLYPGLSEDELYFIADRIKFFFSGLNLG